MWTSLVQGTFNISHRTGSQSQINVSFSFFFFSLSFSKSLFQNQIHFRLCPECFNLPLLPYLESATEIMTGIDEIHHPLWGEEAFI